MADGFGILPSGGSVYGAATGLTGLAGYPGFTGPTPLGQVESIGGGASFGVNESTNQSNSQSQSANQFFNQSSSNSFIPNYAEEGPLLTYAADAAAMAPQVYQWGQNAYNKSQAQIDDLYRQGQEWASPQRSEERRVGKECRS